MTAREMVEKAKKVGSTQKVGDDILYDAVERLEKMIAKYAGISENYKFGKDEILLACSGEIADGHEELYEAYIKREASKCLEDWDCFERYDALFLLRWKDLREEIIRNGKLRLKRFEQNWNWK